MKEIYILGSGGFSKEVFFLLKEINKSSVVPEYDFKGFIDVTTEENVYVGNNCYPIINEDKFVQSSEYQGACLAVGIGNPKVLQMLHLKLSGKYDFPNLISPTAVGDWESIRMGQGNIITSGCVFTVDIAVGSFNIFNLNTTVGHDAIIESFNVINPGVNISGGVKVGNTNLIGTNATILQNITIGSNSILGAASLLTKHLESTQVAVGVPAKPVKSNS